MSEKLFLSHMIQSDLVYMFENEKLACNNFYFTFGIKQKSNKIKTKKRKIKKKARNKLKSSSHTKTAQKGTRRLPSFNSKYEAEVVIMFGLDFDVIFKLKT